MDYPKFIVSSQKEEAISIKRVKYQILMILPLSCHHYAIFSGGPGPGPRGPMGGPMPGGPLQPQMAGGPGPQPNMMGGPPRGPLMGKMTYLCIQGSPCH